MKKVQYIFGALALITIPNWVQAQTQAKDTTLSRTVVVEQEYNPDIIDASKVNVLPKVMPPTVSKKTVEYDATLAPAGNIPATTMEAYTGAESQDKAKRGYARLGYGNYGNLDARANYLFILPNSDKLNLNFHMNGMDGKLDLPDSKDKIGCTLLPYTCGHGLCTCFPENGLKCSRKLRAKQLQLHARQHK